MVRPAWIGGTHDCSTTRWLTSWRTSHSVQGVGGCHWSGADGVAEVAESRQGAAVQGERVHEWERLVAGLCQLGVSVARQ
jgi:hypothetical protein